MRLLASPKRRLIVLALPLALIASACGTSGAEASCARYASPKGSDSAAGTLKKPFKTAQRLFDSLQPGQTGCLRRGTYTTPPDEEYVLDIDRAGRAGAPIRVQSRRGERARLRGVVHVRMGSHHNTLARLAIEGPGGSNTIKVYAEDFSLLESDITNRGRDGSCIFLGNDDEAPATRTTIRRNYIHDCGAAANGNQDHAIYASETDGGQIVENLIVSPAGYSVHLYPRARGMHVARNVVDGGRAVRGGIVIAGKQDRVSTHNVVERNVIAHVAGFGIDTHFDEVLRTASNTIRSNCVFKAGAGSTDDLLGTVAGNVTADPRFRNRARRDYRMADGRCRSVVGLDIAAAVARTGFGPRLRR